MYRGLRPNGTTFYQSAFPFFLNGKRPSLTTVNSAKDFLLSIFFTCAFHSLLKSEFVYRKLDCIILLGSNWIFWTKAERLVRFHKSQWKLCFADTTKSHALSYFWLCYREKSFFSFPRNIFLSETACLLASKGKLVLEVYVWAKVNYQLSTARQSRLLGGFTGNFSTSSSPRPSPMTVRSRFSAWLYLLLWRTKTNEKLTEKKNKNKKSTATYTFWLYNSWDSCDAWWTVPAPPT